MSEKPILFSGPMVRAILDGAKTQTRRLVKLRDGERVHVEGGEVYPLATSMSGHDRRGAPIGRPFSVGDTMWVKETWRTLQNDDAARPCDLSRDAVVKYDATDDARCIWNRAGERVESWFNRGVTAKRDTEAPWEKLPWGKTRVSIHMPRWASRLTLRVTDVHAERLGDISEEDALAEGAMHWLASSHPDRPPHPATPRSAFALLWLAVHGDGAWERDRDRWVWVCGFEVVR